MSAADQYPADASYTETSRLDKEGEEKLVQRLYYTQQELARQRDQERMETLRRSRPQCSTKKITKEEEDRLVNRMYDQQLERFAASKAERERKAEAETQRKTTTMDSEGVDSQVKRMYDEELAKSRQRRQDLEQRYHPKQSPKKVNKEEMKAAVERLSHVDYAKRDEELFQKYVYPNDPKSATISKDEEAAMATRLSTTKGSA